MDGGAMRVDNPAPVVFRRRAPRKAKQPTGQSGGAQDEALDEDTREAFDAAEVYEHVRNICDPEHPYTLEQARARVFVPGAWASRHVLDRLTSHVWRRVFALPLQLNVLTEDNIHVDDAGNRVQCVRQQLS
jgi:hypothetical protein